MIFAVWLKQNAGIVFHGGKMKLTTASAYDSVGSRKYLNRNEGRRFLAHTVALPKVHALFCLMIYYTGCRISEALDVRRRDLDIETGVIVIRTLKRRERKEVRRIPLPEFLNQQLIDVSPSNDDQRIWNFSRTTGWRIIKAAMRSADISGIEATAKGLRHGFGVRSVLGEIPLNLIQRWMGHADFATTEIYLAVRDEQERELIQKTW